MLGELSSERHMRHLLREAVVRAGTMAAWASANGVPLRDVDDALKRNRTVGAKIARALGFERVTGYRKIEPHPADQSISVLWGDHLRDKSGDQ